VKANRWQDIQALFLAAAELEPEAQASYLAAACRTDASLRDDVMALLAAERGPGKDHLISDAVAQAAGALLADTGQSWVGQRLGPYRLLRELGRGGMGVVYLAERVDEQYHARVALKVVRTGPATRELGHRFRVERQILAGLTHPNIALLLDGGAAPDGAPYLVMEYVDGEPIDAWCDARGLGLDARLALFRSVCAAVQHAHQALVVHRDLKPSNILIARDGTPKLVDFGIAKLLAADDAETTATLRLLTPAYAAPEQVSVAGGRIGVAADVYGLGGVLYRLLTGRTAIDLAGATPGEVERRIREVEPPTPSAVAGGPAAAWRRALRGDLDTILLKTLRKEPERRYPSVEQLAEDLRRYRERRPVLARPDTLRYRAGKFLHRHRVAVAFTAALVALTGVYTFQVARARDRARVEAAKAGQIATFLEELFAVSDPIRSRGQTVTARELLDSGAQRIDRQLADQPEVRATLSHVIGRVYQNLGLFESAARHATAALDTRRRLYGDLHHEVVRSEAQLGLALESQGDAPNAEAHYREQLRIERALHAGDHEDLLLAIAELALFLRRAERLDEADTLLREGLAMRERLGPNEGSLAMLVDGLGATLNRKGDYVGAEPWFRRSVDLMRARVPPDSANLAIAVHNLSGALVDLGKLDEAVALQREALAIYLALYGPSYHQLGTLRSGLGRVLRTRGALPEAEEQFRLALAADTPRLGVEHPDIGTRFGMLGTTLLVMDRHDEAEAALQRALAIRRKALGPEHQYVAISMNELAGLFYARGQWARAERMFREALALRRRVHPPSHPYVAYSLVGLSRTLLAQRRPRQAEPLLSEAAQIRGQALPDGHPLRREVDSLLALTRGPSR
jgi:serine/threonine-protein kinase